ncbi:uncharacterized protein LOC119586602 [Penaeus monodon]|uniref:uncharacterized protein LOC119586602 n=1 Tax=Penaeus monodon TaxID=6687 RepID=UPI0018A6D9DB|nr:uncharacterized protein LOC119586602 [Penaeus monodon]
MKLVAVLVGLLAVCGVQAEDVADTGNEARLIANYQTTTFTQMSTITTVAHYTCVNSAAATPCTGRRRRNINLNIDSNSGDFNPDISETLVGSLSDTELEEPRDGSDKEKFFSPLWKKTTSTFTVPPFPKMGYTVSVSRFCPNASILTTFVKTAK